MTDIATPKTNGDEKLTSIRSEMASSASTTPCPTSSQEHAGRNTEANDVNDLEQSDPKSIDDLLWEEEKAVREEVAKSPFSGNFFGAFLVNIYSAIHIVTVYLISLESIISIILSVSLTVCEYYYHLLYAVVSICQMSRNLVSFYFSHFDSYHISCNEIYTFPKR